MSITTVPVQRRYRPPNATVREMIRYEKAEFLYQLQAVIILAGGIDIPVEELDQRTIGELLDTLLTNNVEFQLAPIIKIGFPSNDDERWEQLREATYRAQEARTLATRNHNKARLRE